MLTAAQHGNEVQGAEAIRRFMDVAVRRLKAGMVLAVPFTNPLALRERRHHIHMRPEAPVAQDPSHYNMNRTWPGRRNGNDIARLAWAIYREFGEQATHVLDIHCWSKFKESALLIQDLPPYRQLARQIGHRFVDVAPGGLPRSGTLGAHMRLTGRVGVGYECSGQYLIDLAQVRKCLRVIVNMAHAIGMLRGNPEPADRPILFSDRLERLVVTAPCSGLFAQADLKCGDKVKKGQLLGTLLSDETLQCIRIMSPASGYLRSYGASHPHSDVSLAAQHPYASAGGGLAQIVWPQA